MKVRTRFAPSPTGLLHPGGMRTALFAWLFAKKSGGEFILRIEDTDKARETKGAVEYIYESLRWLGIDWDEGPDKGGDLGPYQQSERLDIYKEYAHQLLAKGLAYGDPYTQAELTAFRQEARDSNKPFLFRNFRPEKPPAWQEGMPLRFKVPALKSYAWQDAVRGNLSAGPEALDDFVVIKSDGYPTYNFANVVDDHLMQISHVLRGEEYIASIPKYLSLYAAFGWEAPINATVPLVLGKTGGKKLSKRDGSMPILEYRDLGYLPAAINNFLATLGWNDGSEQEVFTTEELIAKFNLKRLQKAPARFDSERLNYLNGVHIRRLELDELDELAAPFWSPAAQAAPAAYRRQALELVQERLKYLGELKQLTEFFFTDPKVTLADITAKQLSAAAIKQHLVRAQQVLDESEFSETVLETTLRSLAQELKLAPGVLFQLIRQAVTGSNVAPGLFETLAVLGRETTLRRLEHVLHSKA